MAPTFRLFTAAVCLAAWLVLLLSGFAFGGAVHLLAAAGVALAWPRPGAREELAESR